MRPAPIPRMADQLPPWLTVHALPNFPKWQLVRVEYISADDPRNNQSVNIYVKTLDRDGKFESGVRVWQEWTDDRAAELTKRESELYYAGEPFGCTFFMSGDSSFSPDRGERGAYACYVDGASDRIEGLGLPLRRHVQYLLVFRRVEKPAPPPVPPLPPSPPTAPPPQPPAPPLLGAQLVVSYQDDHRIVIEVVPAEAHG